jgi:hypothetical protein
MNERVDHPIYTEGDPLLGKEDQEKLNDLRRRQIESVGDFTDEERAQFLELQEKESQARKEREIT